MGFKNIGRYNTLRLPVVINNEGLHRRGENITFKPLLKMLKKSKVHTICLFNLTAFWPDNVAVRIVAPKPSVDDWV